MKAEEKHECPPHHWMINSMNMGRCKYCPEVKDFGEFFSRGASDLEAKAKRGGTQGKRGRKPKEKEEKQ